MSGKVMLIALKIWKSSLFGCTCSGGFWIGPRAPSPISDQMFKQKLVELQ